MSRIINSEHNIAAKKAMDQNPYLLYPGIGYPELRKAVVAKIKNENGLDDRPPSPNPCPINPGEEVIIYALLVSYSEVVKLVEGV